MTHDYASANTLERHPQPSWPSSDSIRGLARPSTPLVFPVASSSRAIGKQRPQSLARGRRDAALGDEAGDKARRRHVEGGICGPRALGRDAHTLNLPILADARHMRDLLARAFLDRD